MSDEKTFDELAFETVPDYFDYVQVVDKHNEELEVKAAELAKEKAEDLFNAHKKDYRLEVIKEIDEVNKTKKRAEISRSSPYISEMIIVDGKKLHGCDFINDAFRRNPLYEEAQLIYNEYCCEYQLLYKNGKRKFISVFVVVACVIVNATGPGKCKAIVVYLRGVDTPLVFYDGDVSPAAIRRQTRFCQKGLNVSSEVYCASFLQAMRVCSNVFFLTIPEHSGWNLLQGGRYEYASSLSVIHGLEELYLAEIKQHKLIQHDREFAEVITEYRTKLLSFWKIKLALAIRLMSLLLSFFEDEGLKSDRIIVFTPRNEADKEKFIAITKRFNYASTVATSLTDRITKVRAMLAMGNDVTVIFTYLDGINDTRSFENALREIRMDVTGENGVERPTRKVVIILTDTPGSIPEEYPAYYLSFTEEIGNIDTQVLQRLSGELDYSLIQFLINNPDAAKSLVHESVTIAKTLLIDCEDYKHSGTMTMLIATFVLLKKLKLVSGIELQAVLNWFGKDATTRTSIADAIVLEFKAALSAAILSGELSIAKQLGPPFYIDDGHTVFIAEKDRSINLSEDVIRNIILTKIKLTRSLIKVVRTFNEKGLLISKHTNKRMLNVAVGEGVTEDIETYSFSRKVLDSQSKAVVDNVIDGEYWFMVGEYPEGFIHVLYNADRTKTAGYVFKPDMDINRHEYYFGTTRSGKTFSLVQASLFMAAANETVVIFDQTGAYTENELKKHINSELVHKYFSFWNVYTDGLPVDLLDLRGCTSNKEKKERLTRIYAIAARTLGSYEEQILKNALKHMLNDMKKNPNIIIFDILKYISKDNVKDEAHRRLLFKLDAVLDDLRELPLAKINWDEFIKAQGKPIIVISTGADNIGKGSEIIDMLLENMYCFKQCYPSKQYTVVVDEVQDLYLNEKGSLNTILRKGGKHGISMLLASQAFPDANTPLGKVVGNCGRVRGYRPKADDLERASKFFKCGMDEVNALLQGRCFDNGLFFSRYRGENVITTLKGRTVNFLSDSAKKIKPNVFKHRIRN